MTIWRTLKLSPTKDVKAIKAAYRQQLKVVHPEENPESFQALREAYETALSLANQYDVETNNASVTSEFYSSATNVEQDPLILELEALLGDSLIRFNLTHWELWTKKYHMVSLTRQECIYDQALGIMQLCRDWMVGEVYELLWRTFEWESLLQHPNTEELGYELYFLTQQHCLLAPEVLGSMPDAQQITVQQQLVPLSRALNLRDIHSLRQLLQQPLPKIECEIYYFNILRLYSSIGECPDAVLRNLLDYFLTSDQCYTPQLWQKLHQLCQLKCWKPDIDACIDQLLIMHEYTYVAESVMQSSLVSDPRLALAMALIVQNLQPKPNALWRFYWQLRPVDHDIELQMLYQHLLGNPLLTLREIDEKLLSPENFDEFLVVLCVVEKLGSVAQIGQILSLLEQEDFSDELQHPDWQRWLVMIRNQLNQLLEYLKQCPPIIDILEQKSQLRPTEEMINALNQEQWYELVRRYPNIPYEWQKALQRSKILPEGEQPLAEIGALLRKESLYLSYLFYLRQPNKNVSSTREIAEIQFEFGQANNSPRNYFNQWYLVAAEHGHAKAQFNLGLCYEHGNGVEQDPAQAAVWYTRAAEQGDAEAQYNLGLCYYNGVGVKQDLAQAMVCWAQAAEQGHSGAQSNLGFCYENGYGVEENPAQAVEWYTQAAEQGHLDAQFNLGVCYDNGYGVEENRTQAVEWYTRAADQGHLDAQFNLGVCYHTGYGVEENRTQAAEWYTRAADQGHLDAQYNLGLCYGNGDSAQSKHTKLVGAEKLYNLLVRFCRKLRSIWPSAT